MPAISDRKEATAAADPTAGDRLGLHARRRTALAWLCGLTVLLVISLVAGVGIGAVSVAPQDVFRIVAHHLLGRPDSQVTWDWSHDSIVWDVRLPRVVLGAVVGAGLAVCGAALQAMVRNVLADPYILGINSGASCGAAGAILFGVGAGLGEYALQTSAFLGALAAAVLVFAVARTRGGSPRSGCCCPASRSATPSTPRPAS